MNDPVAILIVDDRAENLLSLEALLQGDDLAVVKAASGREALAQSLKQEFALILLDVQMPEMDGFETAELLRGNPKTSAVPIIFVTAGEKSSNNLFKGYESGAVDYIFKPIDPAILLSKVRIFCELFRQRRALERQEQTLERLVAERTRALSISEERYRRLLESVSSYVYTVFCEHGVPVRTEHGRGCEAVTGYPPEEYLADPWLWLRLVDAEDRPLVEAFNRRLLTEKCTLTIEHRLHHRDGSLRWIQNTLVPRLSLKGELLSYDGVISDITPRRKAEEDLCRALELASASSKAKNEFLANMSHEIRTPMTGIMGAIDLLRDQTTSREEREQYLDIIGLSANNLLRLIDDILDLSKIEVGKVAINSCSFSLRDSLDEVLATQIDRIREKGLCFLLDIAAEVPDQVCGDPLRLKQILLNLLGNAIKFTQRGEIRLRVALAQRHEEQVTLRFQVEDTGVGIAPQALERIFLPFEQADSSMTRRFGGSGLGLSICQRLTDLMGGGIEVSSQEGIGSSFTVSLPLTIGTAVPARNTPAAARALPGRNAPQRTVLLVEDSPISQKIIRKMLAALGYAVVAADNGREALKILARGQFDLVLMDIQMPVMDGLDTLVQIRSKERHAGRHLPVVAVTAHALVGDREKYLGSGFDDYLAKPFRSEDLDAIIARSLAKTTPDSSPAPH